MIDGIGEGIVEVIGELPMPIIIAIVAFIIGGCIGGYYVTKQMNDDLLSRKLKVFDKETGELIWNTYYIQE